MRRGVGLEGRRGKGIQFLLTFRMANNLQLLPTLVISSRLGKKVQSPEMVNFLSEDERVGVRNSLEFFSKVYQLRFFN